MKWTMKVLMMTKFDRNFLRTEWQKIFTKFSKTLAKELKEELGILQSKLNIYEQN